MPRRPSIREESEPDVSVSLRVPMRMYKFLRRYREFGFNNMSEMIREAIRELARKLGVDLKRIDGE